jgi:23S rRNA (guanosine2251-2'-O)-methyltransferase
MRSRKEKKGGRVRKPASVIKSYTTKENNTADYGAGTVSNTIEGRNPVMEALRSGRPLGKVLLAKNIERHGTIAEILHLAASSGIPVEYIERQAIDRLSRTGASQGIIAIAAAKEFISLDDLLAIPEDRQESAFFIILDGIEDPHNLGAILRTAYAAGVHGVIIRERRAVGLTPIVEKASAGALEYVPVARVVNISQTIEVMKQRNIWIVGIDRSAETDYTKIDYKPATAIVIGGEGQGLSELVKKRCDFLASIPMKGNLSSLNASVAAAIVLYEVFNQRK